MERLLLSDPAAVVRSIISKASGIFNISLKRQETELSAPQSPISFDESIQIRNLARASSRQIADFQFTLYNQSPRLLTRGPASGNGALDLLLCPFYGYPLILSAEYS
jgi:hypothetical protein